RRSTTRRYTGNSSTSSPSRSSSRRTRYDPTKPCRLAHPCRPPHRMPDRFTAADLLTSQTPVALRAVQTRAFDTTDTNLTTRTVIATLQDLGFVVDKADERLGAVSATKLDGYTMRMTVTVRLRGETQTAVRASAQYDLVAVTDAQPYQQFFSALEKAMFLMANEVD